MGRKKSLISLQTKEQVLQIYEYEKQKAKEEMERKIMIEELGKLKDYAQRLDADKANARMEEIYKQLEEAKKEGSSPLDINTLATAEDSYSSVSPEDKDAQRKKWMEWMIQQDEFKDDLKSDIMRMMLDGKPLKSFKMKSEIIIPKDEIRRSINGNK